MSTTLLALEKLLNEVIGDDLEFDTTTNIAAGVLVYSTTLQSHDGSQNDAFNERWLYFTEGNNASVLRKVSDYGTTAGKLTVRGANLSTEAAAVTLRLHRYNRTNKINALKRAIEQLYPTLYKPIDNQILITGNMLPNAHFEDWLAATSPDFYLPGTATVIESTAPSTLRGGRKSMKVTAGATPDYCYISSLWYPKLLDLRGKSVSLYAYALPEVLDTAYVEIYTLDASGVASAQTLTSTTACPVTYFTLLKLENQAIQSDAVRIDIRFKVKTTGKYAYFDDAYLVADNQYEYILPSEFQTGHIFQTRVQESGDYDKAYYNLNPRKWGIPEQFRIYQRGDFAPSGSTTVYTTNYNVLRFQDLPGNGYRIRLVGMSPLESLTSDSATIYLDGEKLNLIIAQAAALLFKLEQGPVSSVDKGRYQAEIMYWEAKAARLKANLGMIPPSATIWTGN